MLVAPVLFAVLQLAAAACIKRRPTDPAPAPAPLVPPPNPNPNPNPALAGPSGGANLGGYQPPPQYTPPYPVQQRPPSQPVPLQPTQPIQQQKPAPPPKPQSQTLAPPDQSPAPPAKSPAPPAQSPAPSPKPQPQTPAVPAGPNPAKEWPAFGQLEGRLDQVRRHAIEKSTHSWEYGALFQARLELEAAHLTPYNWNPSGGELPVDLLQSAVKYLEKYDFGPVTETNARIEDYLGDNPPTPLQPKILVDGDGSLADPASVGVAAWLLAMYADKVPGAKSRNAYAWAVANQIQYLRQGQNRDGCMSHREEQYELWSDQGFMISPFLAFVGMAAQNGKLLEDALHQWSCAAEQLWNGEHKAWKHREPGDPGIWATGNGWMLLGIDRVVAAARASTWLKDFSIDKYPAIKYVDEAYASLFSQLDQSNRLPNYMYDTYTGQGAGTPEANGGESAGTAATVAAAFRWAKMFPDSGTAKAMLEPTKRMFQGVLDKINDNGMLTGCVYPLGTGGFLVKEGVESPEGQTFTMMMYAAVKAFSSN